MVTENIVRAEMGWRFWLVWMGASIVGAIAYLFVVPVLYSVLIPYIPGFENGTLAPEQQWIGFVINLASAAALGAVIGLAQWLLLRRFLNQFGWWVLATAIGYAIPLELGPLMPFSDPAWLAGVIVFLMFGIALGIPQWLVLRGRVYQAGWWIAISMAGWLLAFALTGIAYLSGLYVEPFDLFSAFLVPIAIAGGGIIWLLQHPATVVQIPS